MVGCWSSTFCHGRMLEEDADAGAAGGRGGDGEKASFHTHDNLHQDA